MGYSLSLKLNKKSEKVRDALIVAFDIADPCPLAFHFYFCGKETTTYGPRHCFGFNYSSAITREEYYALVEFVRDLSFLSKLNGSYFYDSEDINEPFRLPDKDEDPYFNFPRFKQWQEYFQTILKLVNVELNK